MPITTTNVTEQRLCGRGRRSFTYVTTEILPTGEELMKVSRFSGIAYCLEDNINYVSVYTRYLRYEGKPVLCTPENAAIYEKKYGKKLNPKDNKFYYTEKVSSEHFKAYKHIAMPDDFEAIKVSQKGNPYVRIKVIVGKKSSYKTDYYVNGQQMSVEDLVNNCLYEPEPYITDSKGNKVFTNYRTYNLSGLFLNDRERRF